MGVISNFIKNTHKAKDPARGVPGVSDANIVANVLENISGVGCRIDKPTNRDGLGWQVIIDGTSDVSPPDDYQAPWIELDHGTLSGLDGDDHPHYWLRYGDFNRNVAGSALITDFLRVDAIQDEAGFSSIDTANRSLVDSTGTKISVDYTDRHLVNSAGATVLDWETDGVFKTGAGVARKTDTLTTSATLDGTNHVVNLDGTSAVVTATLPAAPVEGQEYPISCVNSDNAVTIGRNGKTIAGEAADFVMYAGESLVLRYSAANGWWAG